MKDLKEPFRIFLEEEQGLSPNSANQYCSYLTNIHHDLVDVIPEGSNLMQEVYAANNNGVEDVFYHFNYLLNSAIGKVKTTTNDAKEVRKLQNARSSLRQFCAFLYQIGSKKGSKRAKVRKKIEQIDAYDELIALYPSIPVFIDAIVSQCYFFAPDVVERRHQEMVQILAGEVDERLSARYSTKQEYYDGKIVRRGQKDVPFTNAGCKIKIDIDRNGNYDVRRMIKKLTGYSLEQGQNSDFVNFDLSHIWGKAWHPYYFTGLWNVVLVPSYINDILDKTVATSGSGEWPSILYDTLQAIIIELYGLKKYDWTPFVGIEKNYKTAAKKSGTYTINVIHLKLSGQKESDIEVKIITI